MSTNAGQGTTSVIVDADISAAAEAAAAKSAAGTEGAAGDPAGTGGADGKGDAGAAPAGDKKDASAAGGDKPGEKKDGAPEAKTGEKPKSWGEALRWERKARAEVDAAKSAAQRQLDEANALKASVESQLAEVKPLLEALKSGDLRSFLGAGKFSLEQMVDLIAEEKREPTPAEIARAEAERIIAEREAKAEEKRKADDAAKAEADKKAAEAKKAADEKAWDEQQARYRKSLGGIVAEKAADFPALNALPMLAKDPDLADLAPALDDVLQACVDATVEAHEKDGTELLPHDVLAQAEQQLKPRIIKLAQQLAGIPWVAEAIRPKSAGKTESGRAGAQTITTRNTTGVGAARANDGESAADDIDFGDAALVAAIKRSGNAKYLAD